MASGEESDVIILVVKALVFCLAAAADAIMIACLLCSMLGGEWR